MGGCKTSGVRKPSAYWPYGNGKKETVLILGCIIINQEDKPCNVNAPNMCPADLTYSLVRHNRMSAPEGYRYMNERINKYKSLRHEH